MKRTIVDYQKLNDDILSLLVEKFPDGYESEDIIVFRNANNEIIEAVEVRTDNTVYLVKVSQRLVDSMENYQEEDDLEDDYDDDEIQDTETDVLVDEEDDY